jgi:hypothetical protein
MSNSENIKCLIQFFISIFLFVQPYFYDALERLVAFPPKVVEEVLFFLRLCFHHSYSEPRVEGQQAAALHLLLDTSFRLSACAALNIGSLEC